MRQRTYFIFSILILTMLTWALAGYSFNGYKSRTGGWLRSHIGEEMLITLQVSLIDEIGKVLIAKLIDVEEAGIVVTLIGDINSDKHGRSDQNDIISIWVKQELPVMITYSSMVTIEPFDGIKDKVFYYLRKRHDMKKRR